MKLQQLEIKNWIMLLQATYLQTTIQKNAANDFIKPLYYLSPTTNSTKHRSFFIKYLFFYISYWKYLLNNSFFERNYNYCGKK